MRVQLSPRLPSFLSIKDDTMTRLTALENRCLLIILDGFGISKNVHHNAITLAKTPCLDRLMSDYPYKTITASGSPVGLPQNLFGNSEVGHVTLGAGRALRQDIVTINTAIKNNTLIKKEKFNELIEYARSHSKRIHLLGLLSDGGVHSHIDHVIHLKKIFSLHPDLQIFYHIFMDGRDTPPASGVQYLKKILKETSPNFYIASLQGRSFGMDRDRRWDRIAKAYYMLTGKAEVTSLSPLEYLRSEYQNNYFDEFIRPVLFNKSMAVEKEDALFFLNFRPDRAVELTLAFNQKSFTYFERSFLSSYYLCMTPYVSDEIDLPILFNKDPLRGGLSEILSEQGLRQYKIAETEKYAHITYFFNGGVKQAFSGEERVVIPSLKHIATYDQAPEMSADKITVKLLAALEKEDHSFYLVNYANCDMVGHTGNLEATIKAVETIDRCLDALVKLCEEKNIPLLLTADHGNADQMQYDDGSIHTAHTNAPVPFIFFHPKFKKKTLEFNGKDHSLQDIAPTILDLLGIAIPDYFSGKTLFK